MERLLKKELEGVDEVFFYDWRVRRSKSTLLLLLLLTTIIPAAQGCSFQERGNSQVDLDSLSRYLLPVENTHIGKPAEVVVAASMSEP